MGVDIQELLSALDVFSRAPDKASIERANTWLQDFQHSNEAWLTCRDLLLSPEAPPAAKLFAAQTFRSKVTYDLQQLDTGNVIVVRDTILAALQSHSAGPRNLTLQLCLALAGLALQLPSWDNAVQTMIDTFGRDPTTVSTLLQFLTLMPEELNTNTRIPITDDEYKERSALMLTANAKKIMDLLTVYIQAEGVTQAVQTQIFNCLRSWLIAGEVAATELSETPLFGFAFEALASDELFDSAVDVICEIIHETQEIDDNMPVIQLIVPRVVALRPDLAKHVEDPDRIRGYARIFAEAGETYRTLIIHHPETFFPLVEAIGECSAYPDLDIVPITFQFWMRLAQMIGKRPSIPPVFISAYKALMDVMLRHLQFPVDENTLTAQETDTFRSFRHVIGDTLKDCCFVIGTETGIDVTYQMITSALTRHPTSLSWQEVEAPLFAIRAIGGTVDENDNTAVPKIMDLIPSLPNHPKVRYAALLIISRYSEWINMHPDYIRFTLEYVSSGFQDTDQEVCAAAGQALKYLCRDCKAHLVDFLPTLHTFLSSTGPQLVQDDRHQVYEAIAFVISAMPMDRAAESLRAFSNDILAQVHAVNNSASPTKAEMQNVSNGLENLETMLNVIRSFGEELPAACANSCQEAWALFDVFISKYGSQQNVADRVTRVLRHGITFFDKSALPVVPSAISRLSLSFDTTGLPCYLWIAGKLIGRFGDEESLAVRSSFQEVYERSTNRVVAYLQTTTPRDIPDVLEDYIQMLLSLSESSPDILFQSAAFPMAFKASMEALTLVVSDVVFAALDLFRTILTHESLTPDPSRPTPPKFPIYAAAIQAVFEAHGIQFIAYLLNGLIGNFPEDCTSAVVSIFRAVAALWGAQLLSWLPTVLEQLPTSTLPNETKARFLSEVSSAINSHQYDKVKYAILSLTRASWKARERRRAAPI